MSKITSGDSYKYTHTNYNLNLVDPEYLYTNTSMSPSMIPSIMPTKLPKLRKSKIRQQIWSRIFDNKQDPKDPKRYFGSGNHWPKAKENWDAAISVEQCDFILKSKYTPT